MKILITGAGGQLGRDCTRVFTATNTVLALDSQQLDITDQDQVKHHFLTFKPDIVINCAAYTGVDGCESEHEKCWQVNAHGAGIIASACAQTDARMIHISTDYVFDGSKPVPGSYGEEEKTNPLCRYGASKLAGEEQVRTILKEHIILRTSWLYGIGGPNFLKTMLRLAVADPRRTIRVVNDQFGSFTWTSRLALQIQSLLASEMTGTFHATAEGHTTWYKGAKLFLEAMQIPFVLEPCSTREYPAPARRPVNSILANSRLHKYRLNQMVPWEEDVLRFAGDYRPELLAEVTG